MLQRPTFITGRHVALVATVLSLLVVGTGGAAQAVAPYDFDGDGTAELAWNVHNNVLIAPVGPDGTPNIHVHTSEEMNLPTSANGPLDQEAASGDFNADGAADLAVLAEWGAGNEHRGVMLLPGGRRVPRASSALLIEQEFGELDNDGWSWSAFIARDVDRDGFSDLIVMLPTYDDNGPDAVTYILWGGTDHLSWSRATRFTSTAPAASVYAGPPIVDVGQLDGDARLEILIGEQSDRDGTDDDNSRLGWLAVCDVSTARAVACDLPFETPRFGRQPVVGDVVGGRYDDVVLPYADEVVYSTSPAGGLYVYRGTAAGLRTAPVRVTQNTAGIPGTSERGDAFGFDLAIGNINGRGKRDLLVGAPGEDRRGSVTVVFGHTKGLGRAGGKSITPATAGIRNTKYDTRFGFDVGLRDLMGNGTADLITTSPCASGKCRIAHRCGAFWIVPTGGAGQLRTARSTRVDATEASGTSRHCLFAGYDVVPD